MYDIDISVVIAICYKEEVVKDVGDVHILIEGLGSFLPLVY